MSLHIYGNVPKKTYCFLGVGVLVCLLGGSLFISFTPYVMGRYQEVKLLGHGMYDKKCTYYHQIACYT